MHTDSFKIVFLQFNAKPCRNTELHVPQAVNKNDGASKENLHLDDQSKQVFFFRVVFSKRNRKHVLHISTEL